MPPALDRPRPMVPSEWKATITPTRFGWYVRCRYGSSDVDGRFFWRRTREGAEKRARRWIERQQREQDRLERETFEVTVE